MMKDTKIKRIKTGIPKLDSLVEGGFPKGSIILITGPPGSGKTILGLQYLYNGATLHGDKGSFISFEMPLDEIYLQSSQMGWNLKDVDNRIDVSFVKSIYQMTGSSILEPIVKTIKESGSKRVVFDSSNSFFDFFIPKTLKSQPYLGSAGYNTLVRYAASYLIGELRKLDATIILISNSCPDKDSGSYSYDGVSDYLCDGIINLNYLNMGGEQLMSLEIPKMRLTAQEKEFIPYKITNKGIVLNTTEKSSLLMK